MGSHPPTNESRGLPRGTHHLYDYAPNVMSAYGLNTFLVAISAEPKRLTSVLADLAGIPKGVEQALSRALNKVGTSARVHIVRTIASEINVKQSELRRRNVKETRATYRRLVYRIIISGRRIPLRRFLARQTARGVSYSIRSGSRTVLEHSFMTDRAGRPLKMPTGHQGVFMRYRGGARTSPRYSRLRKERSYRHGLPIAEKFGPSVPAAMENAPELAQTVLNQKISSDLGEEIHTQVGLVLAMHKSRV